MSSKRLAMACQPEIGVSRRWITGSLSISAMLELSVMAPAKSGITDTVSGNFARVSSTPSSFSGLRCGIATKTVSTGFSRMHSISFENDPRTGRPHSGSGRASSSTKYAVRTPSHGFPCKLRQSLLRAQAGPDDRGAPRAHPARKQRLQHPPHQRPRADQRRRTQEKENGQQFAAVQHVVAKVVKRRQRAEPGQDRGLSDRQHLADERARPHRAVQPDESQGEQAAHQDDRQQPDEDHCSGRRRLEDRQQPEAELDDIGDHPRRGDGDGVAGHRDGEEEWP